MLFPWCDWALGFLFCLWWVCLGGCREGRIRRLAEEADQPFDVLGSRRQEELLTDKLHPAQPQATQSYLILEFRKQGFHFLWRCALANSGVLTNSRARCRAGSWTWMARYLYWPVVHCAFCEHAPQRLRFPM